MLPCRRGGDPAADGAYAGGRGAAAPVRRRVGAVRGEEGQGVLQSVAQGVALHARGPGGADAVRASLRGMDDR